jgi:ribosomal-protein-alanine N-acetyltransferase
MSLFPIEMDSERLRYERLHPNDVDPWELYEYTHVDAPNIDEITEHVSWNPYTHPKEAFNWVERCGERFETGEGATYVLRPKGGEDEGKLAGLGGLHPNWDVQSATLGIWLRKPFWGRGYSGERAAQMLEIAFSRLNLETVVATHDPANDNSKRAIEKYI